jgi:RimJ/RimL family protein N-acetyltransferase
VRPMAEKPQHPPTIELDGARLRPLRVADAAALYAYLRDPVVTELTSYPVASVPMVEAMIERSLSRWAAGELSRWGVALPSATRVKLQYVDLKGTRVTDMGVAFVRRVLPLAQITH